MMHKLSIVAVPTCDHSVKRPIASAFDPPQMPTNYSLIVVCIMTFLFALAGYGIAELSLLY